MGAVSSDFNGAARADAIREQRGSVPCRDVHGSCSASVMRVTGLLARRQEDAMYPEPQRLVDREVCIRWVGTHCVRYDEAGKLFDLIAHEYYLTTGGCHEPLAPDPTGPTCATHESMANTAQARVLLVDVAVGRRGSDLGFNVGRAQVLDQEGRIVPRRPMPEAGGEWQSIATPGAVHQEIMHPHDFPITGSRP